MNLDPITDAEKAALSKQAASWGATLDFEKVADYAEEFVTTNESISPGQHLDSPPNKRAAALLLFIRDEKAAPSSEEEDFARQQIISHLGTIVFGKDMLDQNGTYWRFKPTIEKILELDMEQSKQAKQLLDEFQNSDYGLSLSQQSEEFLQSARYWYPEKETTKSIDIGIECYRNALGIFERGFPLLLGLKRILDGKQPSLRALQEMRASKVRRELTDTEAHENSAYFDLIVSTFKSSVRNGLAHGDLVHDPREEVIKIPNKRKEFGYNEFNEILSENISVGIFLTGMFQSLITWSVHIQLEQGVTRDYLPL